MVSKKLGSQFKTTCIKFRR